MNGTLAPGQRHPAHSALSLAADLTHFSAIEAVAVALTLLAVWWFAAACLRVRTAVPDFARDADGAGVTEEAR